MPSILKRTPRVLVIQETCVQPGKDKLQGIFNYVHLYGPWHLHLIQSRAGEQTIRALADWNEYDGIIADQMAFEMADVLRQTRKPVILMVHPDPALHAPSLFSRLSCVLEDSASIGAAGAAYFLARGYKHFAYVGEALGRNWSIVRGVAFEKRAEADGCACDLYAAPAANTDWKTERKHLLLWLKALPKPVGLLAAMDTRAHQVLDACAEAGLRVPHDVAVLGVDNDELICNGSIPTLSSIQRDTLTCGFLAAQVLDSLMRKSARKKQILSYGVSRIVSRDSTRTDAAPADLMAIRAREFIRINVGERIGVPDVVRHLHVSRRLAELRFRAAYGISLLEEIRNARLERVRRLLSETDLTLAEICDRCDYQTDIHLRRIFKRRFGCSMREYRQRSPTRNRAT
ncbi:MAG TPA: XylR family transcriptional regulator [Kiritimatiellia bacterium]|nr:XylR family transcriptional regulator [Kiritimatiellia bacterium]HPS07070.1 XylR family transcriptional regulator [Kiritimatiellia bacterium]